MSLWCFSIEKARALSLSLFFIGVSLATAQVPTVEIFCKRQEMTSMIYTRFMFFIRYGWHFCNQTEKFFPLRLCPFGFSILSYLLSGFYWIFGILFKKKPREAAGTKNVKNSIHLSPKKKDGYRKTFAEC